MTDADMLVITGTQIDAILAGRHREITDVIRAAYQAHGRQADSLPQASTLRFAQDRRNRIIALPASVGGDTPRSGLKWISSFPANTDAGLERASAVILMNSMTTGRVTAVLEGSLISAKRTAASAALAAAEVHRSAQPSALGLIGGGRINYEILQFLLAVGPPIDSAVVYDQSPSRAQEFARRCGEIAPNLKIGRAESTTEVLGACSLVSFATTAIEPHVPDLSMCPPGATILHISLRDIAPQAILDAENVVDDIDHVCAAQTSVHLAEQTAGHRDFIRTTICDVLLRRAAPRADARTPLIFSPFGMGTLDIALAGLVLESAGDGESAVLPDFWPAPWNARERARAGLDAR
jgi:2,3-diaminopropionate biosynthesis protein SbnB